MADEKRRIPLAGFDHGDCAATNASEFSQFGLRDARGDPILLELGSNMPRKLLRAAEVQSPLDWSLTSQMRGHYSDQHVFPEVCVCERNYDGVSTISPYRYGHRGVFNATRLRKTGKSHAFSIAFCCTVNRRAMANNIRPITTLYVCYAAIC